MGKKVTVWVTNEEARKKVEKIVEALDGLQVKWAETDSWDGFVIEGRKEGEDVRVRGYLEGEEEFYMLEIRTGSRVKEMHICGTIYESLKKMAEEINDQHFIQMKDLWNSVEIEKKELR